MAFREKLSGVIQRYQDLEIALAAKDAPLSTDFALHLKELKGLEPLVDAIQALEAFEQELSDLNFLKASDDELRALAEEEALEVKAKLQAQELAIRTLLIPPDKDDNRNAILEIRAGTGGEEAALFAADLLRMYCRYSETKRWKVEHLQLHESEHGGIKEAGLLISGKDVFAKLKFEAGVHRVQRIPETESSGRIHTSAATVAVLPEAEDIDIQVEEKDLRIDVFRSSGPGGQSVNTTDSAVRITHIPTGLVVQQQDEKSQRKNKAKALKILRARLYEQKKSQALTERALSRHHQVGRGDRSERIRTYNFPQGRLTDHRIKLTLHKLPLILEGPGLEEIIQALSADDRLHQMTLEGL